jgi:hypothetical protein
MTWQPIETIPQVTEDDNGNEFYTFGPEHTFADVARWIVSEGGLEDMLYLLNQIKDLKNENT